MSGGTRIRTPDQRLRVFVSSTLTELVPERAAARSAIEQLQLVPVMFELGARPHPPRELYRAYLEQSDVFVGIYWQRYGWIAPGEPVSGLEDEYRLAGNRPQLLYLKEPADERDPELERLLADIRDENRSSYRRFESPAELVELVRRDLALLLSERFHGDERGPAPFTAVERPPVPLAPILGRERERVAVAALLTDDARLVTLTGPGGVGKTRLALAVAADVADRYRDGVLFVPLVEVDSATRVVPTIAARLMPATMDGTDAVAALHQRLAGKHLLIVLDNLEKVVDVAQVLVELLERCPGVQLLATSRRPLRAVGEHEWPLEPLPLPTGSVAGDAVADNPAVELFVSRARAADPRFELSEQNTSAVVELCRQLDGLPLAIELAAARVRLLPPRALLQRLTDQAELPGAGPERPARHRTLRATIDWSAQLLDERQRTIFSRLSVFRGGCTLDAAEQVCDPEGQGDVVEVTAALIDHALVTTTHEPLDDEPRLRMLETVRTDAADRLAARGETALMRNRHLDWFAHFAEVAQPFLCGPHQPGWVARVEPERENLREAAANALATSQYAGVLEMAWDLYIFYYLRGAPDEPEAWVREVAAHPDDLDERQRAVAATALAITSLWRGEPVGAREALETSLTTFLRTGTDFECAVARMHLGVCALEAGEWEAAVTLERDAITTFAGIGHDWGMGACENLLGIALAAAGQRGSARPAHRRALGHGRRIGNASIAAQALVLLAADALDREDARAARGHLAEAVPLLDAARDVVLVCGCLEVQAALALADDDVELAGRALTVATTTRRRLGTPLYAVLRHRVDRLAQAVAERDGERAGQNLARYAEEDPFQTMRAVADVTMDAGRAAVDG